MIDAKAEQERLEAQENARALKAERVRMEEFRMHDINREKRVAEEEAQAKSKHDEMASQMMQMAREENFAPADDAAAKDEENKGAADEMLNVGIIGTIFVLV